MRPPVLTRARAHLPSVTGETARERWWVVALLTVVLPLQAGGVARALDAPGRPPLRDSIIFEYYGWYLTTGAALYRDAWEFKPPLSFETTAVIALLAGEDVFLFHLLNVALTAAVAAACALLVAALVHDLTGDGRAALFAGLFPYALPSFALRAGYGFKAKYFVLAAGLLGVWLARRDRPFAAGLAAAAAPGYWQLGVVFPLLAGVEVWRSGEAGRRDRLCFLVGGAVTTAAVLLPVVVHGPEAVRAMVAETVVAPLVLTEGTTAATRLRRFVVVAWWTLPLLLCGLAGALAPESLRRPDRRWVAGSVAWFGGSVLLVDFDAAPDLFVLLGVLAVGFGHLVADRPRLRRTSAVLLAALLVFNAAFLVGVAPGPRDPDGGPVADPENVTVPYNTNAERRALYWHRIPAETCHVFPNRKQWRWIELTGGSHVAETCGRLPPGVP